MRRLVGRFSHVEWQGGVVICLQENLALSCVVVDKLFAVRIGGCEPAHGH